SGQRKQHHRCRAREFLSLAESRPERSSEPEPSYCKQDARAQGHRESRVLDATTRWAIARSFGACDESDRADVEADRCEFADEVGRGPRETKGAERRAPQQTRDEKDEDSAQERREEGDRIEERATRQRGAGR